MGDVEGVGRDSARNTASALGPPTQPPVPESREAGASVTSNSTTTPQPRRALFLTFHLGVRTRPSIAQTASLPRPCLTPLPRLRPIPPQLQPLPPTADPLPSSVPLPLPVSVHFAGSHAHTQETITDAAFVHLAGMQTLDMSWCNQQTITDADFVHLAGIHMLDMSGCNQDTITDAAFVSLVGIVELY